MKKRGVFLKVAVPECKKIFGTVVVGTIKILACQLFILVLKL
jgi:hypothetical protein